MSEERVALVTGANRGLGLEVCRQLSERGVSVVLGARDVHAVEDAARLLRADCVALDVTEETSLLVARDIIEARHQRLDILVNNAAVGGKHFSILDVPLPVLRETFEINAFGALRLTQAMMSLLLCSGDARVVNVSSGMGALSSMGTGLAAYRLSKACLNAVTVLLAAELAGSQVVVNAVCPGWVRTRMGGEAAPRSVEEGAAGIVWLALDAPRSLSGKFVRDRTVISW